MLQNQIFSLTVILIFFSANLKIYSAENVQEIEKGERRLVPKYTVDLLIVCDKEFSDRFDQDRTKIMNFWAARVWDINMRFKTLSSVDITFRATSLIIIKNSFEQPFVEKVRLSSGNNLDMDQALHKFSEWIYAKNKITVEFDIAFLATGAKVVQSAANFLVFLNSACLRDKEAKKYFSAAVFDIEFILGQKCNVIEHGLARLFGSPWDSVTNQSRGCYNDNPYVMGTTLKGCTGNRQFFFSECTDEMIAQNINLTSAACLHNHNTENIDIFENFKTIKPSTLTEQCRMMTNDRTAVVSQAYNDTDCISTKCISMYGTYNSTKMLYPLQNSPCGINKFCFRGRCIPQAYSISNAATGKCLQSVNRFASDDYLQMETCNKSPSPLDQFMILESSSNGTVSLATAYSSVDAEENGDKCVSVEAATGKLRYKKCSSENLETFGWNLISRGDNKEFLLYNPTNKTCARVEVDNSVTVNETCNGEDVRMRWKFLDIKSIPNEWMTNISILVGHSEKNSDDLNSESPDGNEINVISNNSYNTNINFPEDTEKSEEISWNNWNLIFISVLSGFLLVIVLGSIFVYCLLCRKKKQENSGPPETQENPNYTVAYMKDT